eukprot:TRINITY_DN13535_c0_g1_i2.p3 TRINITY_DN13535_c0_g1~~TRINITY_DN13535_c0_g1_i2.p3  ORF type:complete len:132 (+),score=18.05 TRINITY_DN13535_c0_g1_i2:313-708(+)
MQSLGCSKVGRRVGTCVGSKEGGGVGIIVGMVGARVGFRVGASEGFGAAVGVRVGASVNRISVGAAVGAIVGCVGASSPTATRKTTWRTPIVRAAANISSRYPQSAGERRQGGAARKRRFGINDGDRRGCF